MITKPSLVLGRRSRTAFSIAAVVVVAAILWFAPSSSGRQTAQAQAQNSQVRGTTVSATGPTDDRPSVQFAGDAARAWNEAESLFAEGSYQRALEVYRQIESANADPETKAWLSLRIAASAWRSYVAAPTSDSSELDRARATLQELATTESFETRVHALEELGDSWWQGGRGSSGLAWSFYRQALDLWAGSEDLERARRRYLDIVRRASLGDDPGRRRALAPRVTGNPPLDVLDNALRIAQTSEDRVLVHYLIALSTLYQGPSGAAAPRTGASFEAVLDHGADSGFYQDALWRYANWLADQGRWSIDEQGGWNRQLDPEKALELLERLVEVSLADPGSAPYLRPAREKMDQIRQPDLFVGVSNVFLPGSRISASLRWRNLERMDLGLYRFDLGDLELSAESGLDQALGSLDLARLDAVREWSESELGARYLAHNRHLSNDPLDPGAYLLVARARGLDSEALDARALVLVSDLALVSKSQPGDLLLYLCSVEDGSPILGGSIDLWVQSRDRRSWRRQRGRTDQNGLVRFDSVEGQRYQVFASAGDRPARLEGYLGYRPELEDERWKIYAFTDRPAYRPGDEVRWKILARTSDTGTSASGLETPSGETVEVRVQGPEGEEIYRHEATLNDFGSAWGAIEVDAEMRLGLYSATFLTRNRDGSGERHLGAAQLFRLEEYKLPEYTVTVRPGELPRDPESSDAESSDPESSDIRAYRAGDHIPVVVEAQYLFGGPVRSAQAEILIYQSTYRMPPHRPRPYEWLQADDSGGDSLRSMRPSFQRYRQPEQNVERRVVALDDSGRAQFEIETFEYSAQDLEYRVEARVTDSSRREVSGSGTVRVGRFPYYVDLEPEARIYQPGDRVEVAIRTVDINQKPVNARGRVEVFRRFHSERWIDPAGTAYEGAPLARLRERGRFPDNPGNLGWRLIFQGYRDERIDSTVLSTGDDGEADYRLEIDRAGYYRVTWRGLEVEAGDEQAPVTAENTFFVGDATTHDLGYRHGGVEIVLGRESLAPGERLPMMVITRSPDRWVLLGIDSGRQGSRGAQASDLASYRAIRVDGRSHFLELEVPPGLQPKFFVDATLISEQRFYSDTVPVLLPPVEQDLTVEITADREQYRSGDEGKLQITTRDLEGRAVAAEVAISVADKALLAIQEELTPDPLAFFFGDPRWPSIQTQSSLQQTGYVLIEEEAVEDRDSAAVDLLDLEHDAPASSSVARGSRRIQAKQEMQAVGFVAQDGAVATAEMVSQGQQGEGAPVEVRHDFRATALWLPDVVTDATGSATVDIDYPDSLTTWQLTARAATFGDRFGQGKAETVTTLPFLVRLQTPRFLVEGDQAVIAAVVDNRSGMELSVSADLVVEGGARIDSASSGPDGSNRSFVLASGEEERVEWLLEAKSAGPLRLALAALGEATANARNETAATDDPRSRGPFSDGMERTLTVHPHGLEKLIAQSALLGERADRVEVTLDLPVSRAGAESSLIVVASPSLATTMLDALPYLADYPYGCTEQTLSRFVPAAIVEKTLRDLGLPVEQAMATAFGGIEPGGVPGGARPSRASGSLTELDEMIAQGMARLRGMQNPDGGWPWFPGGPSDPYMTAYAVWSLSLLDSAGATSQASSGRTARPRDQGPDQTSSEMLESGSRFLLERLPESRDAPELQAWLVHALAARAQSSGAVSSSRRPEAVTAALDNLWQKRDRLTAYGRALFLLSEIHLGGSDRVPVLTRNLENGVERGRRGETAWWGETSGWWDWRLGAVESTSFVLRALLAVDPGHPLVVPASRFLIDNRRGAQWNNTRDTAIAVLALNDYLQESGELDTDTEIELLFDGRSLSRHRITPETILTAPRRFIVEPALLGSAGRHRVELVRRQGSGRIYLTAEARVMSAEEPITPASNRVEVSRRLLEQQPRPTLLQGVRFEAVPVVPGDPVSSGTRLEAVITLEADNDLEYLMVEDLKAAGIEAVALQSGQPLYARELRKDAVREEAAVGVATAPPASGALRIARGASPSVLRIQPTGPSDSDYTGRQVWVYQELRDRKVALFLDRLPEGLWEIRYPLRVETPGRYHGLPAVAQAMYVPEVRANGHEQVFEIVDAPTGSTTP